MILRLKKKDNYWRMDKDTFSEFMNHIKPYIKTKKGLPDPSEVLFAEIPNSDIQKIGLLYGYSLEDNSTLLLAKICPNIIILLPSEKSFNIRICRIIDQEQSIENIHINRK
ncbi:MAG: hypothetical protein H6Q15_2384 [Bacteroidetes bacterium]|nr:hypothetical protein [Bacteroidota bacterium]